MLTIKEAKKLAKIINILLNSVIGIVTCVTFSILLQKPLEGTTEGSHIILGLLCTFITLIVYNFAVQQVWPRLEITFITIYRFKYPYMYQILKLHSKLYKELKEFKNKSNKFIPSVKNKDDINIAIIIGIGLDDVYTEIFLRHKEHIFTYAPQVNFLIWFGALDTLVQTIMIEPDSDLSEELRDEAILITNSIKTAISEMEACHAKSVNEFKNNVASKSKERIEILQNIIHSPFKV